MSQAATVTRLALRELWITFRLLVLLAAFVSGGAVVALLPAPPSVSAERLAFGFAGATVLTAAIAAWSVAAERTAGRTGWLVGRSVARGTYLVGWFTATAAVAWVGLAAGATLGWLALSPGVSLDAAGFALVTFAIGMAVGAASALGLLGGALLPVVPAALVAAVACGILAVSAIVLPIPDGLHPAGGLGLLHRLGLPGSTDADGLRAAGIGLSLMAVLLAGARLALERAEL